LDDIAVDLATIHKHHRLLCFFFFFEDNSCNALVHASAAINRQIHLFNLSIGAKYFLKMWNSHIPKLSKGGN
jgi:hypothetical protein